MSYAFESILTVDFESNQQKDGWESSGSQKKLRVVITIKLQRLIEYTTTITMCLLLITKLFVQNETISTLTNCVLFTDESTAS